MKCVDPEAGTWGRWPGLSVFPDVWPSCSLAGLNYVLTADVSKKEKGQLPRVYFVLLGETAGQVSEKLQLAHMEETCRHYVAHVKVSPLSLTSDGVGCSSGTRRSYC